MRIQRISSQNHLPITKMSTLHTSTKLILRFSLIRSFSCSNLFSLCLQQSPDSFQRISKFLYILFSTLQSFLLPLSYIKTLLHPKLFIPDQKTLFTSPNRSFPILLPSLPDHYALNFLRKRPLTDSFPYFFPPPNEGLHRYVGTD